VPFIFLVWEGPKSDTIGGVSLFISIPTTHRVFGSSILRRTRGDGYVYAVSVYTFVVKKVINALSAAQWGQIAEQLALVKKYLLRLDANLVVPTTRQQEPTNMDDTNHRNDENDHDNNYAHYARTGRILVPPTQMASNEQWANHDMFQQDYRHVVLLLQVQQELACLRESLDQIKMDGTYGYRITENRLERAADACRKRLVRVFENQSGDGRGLPESLSLLLYREVNQKFMAPATDSDDDDDNESVAAKLLRQDVIAILLDATHEFSQARLEDKVSQFELAVSLESRLYCISKSVLCELKE
jgi:hypothetical protein